MANFIEIVKDSGRRLAINTNNIISVYDTEGSQTLINMVDENGQMVSLFTSTSFEDVLAQLK